MTAATIDGGRQVIETGMLHGLASAARSHVGWRAAIIASVVLAGTLGLSAATATAAATASSTVSWSIVQSVTPTGEQGALVGASCSSPTACEAVGTYTDSAGMDMTLAEERNGTKWAIQATPDPTGAQGSELFGVSCTSSSSCTAVGYYADSNGVDMTLAEAWNGSTWAIESTPDPSGSQGSELSGVSCNSGTTCTAVGGYLNDSGTQLTLAEAWNGTSWAIESTLDHAGSLDSELSGVSCASATTCTAVGGYAGGSGSGGTLAEAWNGTTWAVQTTADPAGAEGSGLSGVSCTSAAACVAVGSFSDSSGTETTLAEGWNGTTWAIATTPGPAGAVDSDLIAVSCNSAAACMAVGGYADGSGAIVTLAEAWNGTTWAIDKTANPSGAAESYLTGESCNSSNACTAVGYSDTVTLAEAWNGSKWVTEATPDPSGADGSQLSGVSCTSRTACTAVGYYADSSGTQVTLAEGWNGTDWAIEASPDPAGSQGSELSAVSCTSATSCTAVGDYSNSSGTERTLVEAWNGTAWAIETSPDPAGSQGSELSAVSCASATSCTSVGNYTGSSGTQETLAEDWNGTDWATEKTPNPAGSQGSELSGVSCSAATTCTAVGDWYNGSGLDLSLAEDWNGTEWATEKTPNPAGSQGSELSGVSCSAATTCTAVGDYTDSAGTGVTLAEDWNGTEWATEKTPSPTGAEESLLLGASCTTSTACIAAGSTVYTLGTSVPLVESST